MSQLNKRSVIGFVLKSNRFETFLRFWMAGSVLGSAALQNIFSRDMASSRICLRVLVLDSRLFTHPYSRTCTQKSGSSRCSSIVVVIVVLGSTDSHQLLALSLVALQQQWAQAGVQSCLHALDKVATL